MRQIEILAPAGSFDTMKAAYKAGADAVYIGGMLFGARAYADNADMDQMLQAIDYAHLHGRRLYLTVNTLLKNTEIESQLMSYLRPFYEQGLDAVIVQDMGVLQWIHDHFPDLPVHASTQMTVCGADYGRWLGCQGVTRIVTPRELSLDEIAFMKKETGLEIETFVHGALCYCYSGQCLMSSMIGGRSGNRGRCAQPCRLPYSFEGDKGRQSGCLLSPKDLCSLELLPDILSAGVDSLKIEGRMKKPEYAAMTTAVYRKYVDQYLEKGRKGYKIKKEDIEKLMDLYNRGGFTNGYFRRHNGREMMSIARPNHSGLCVGRAESLKKGEVIIHTDHDLNPGDVLELNDQISMKLDRSIRAGSDFRYRYSGKPVKKQCPVMRTRNERLIEEVTENFVKNYDLKEKIYGSVSISKDSPAKIDVYNSSYHLTLEGPIVQAAQNRPVEEEDIRRRLMKTGGTPFIFDKLDISVEEGCYLTVQELNQLRRDVLTQFEAVILQPYRRRIEYDEQKDDQIGRLRTETSDHSIKNDPELYVLVSNLEQLRAVPDIPEIRRIYLNDEGDDRLIAEASEIAHDSGRQFYLAMPYILRNSSAEIYKKRTQLFDTSMTDGFLVRNMETLFMLRSMEVTQPCVSDYNMYCMNNLSSETYLKMMSGITLPLELNRRELSAMKYTADSEMIVYGYLPLMVSAQCLMKTTGKCTGKPAIHMMEDRFHKHFPVKNACNFCYNLIYNCVPLHLADAVGRDLDTLGVKAIRLQFLDETPEKVAEILNFYCGILSGRTVKEPAIREYTKGHYQRGIE
ncbi:MAG: DUF3656 domain-containing protein [Coprococcus sp.]